MSCCTIRYAFDVRVITEVVVSYGQFQLVFSLYFLVWKLRSSAISMGEDASRSRELYHGCTLRRRLPPVTSISYSDICDGTKLYDLIFWCVGICSNNLRSYERLLDSKLHHLLLQT